MNSFTKKCIKFSLILIVIGILMSTIAFALGGKIVNFSTKGLTNISQTYSGIESLNLNLDASEVEIKTGNEFKIEANNISNDTFKSYVQNGKWYIENKITSKIFNINNSNSEVIIYIPESFNAKVVEINIGAGKITVDKLVAATTNITVGAGDLEISDLKTDDINIHCGVGKIEINGIVNNNGYIENGIGKVNLDLKGNSKDYNYELNLGVGKTTLNGECFSAIGSKVINNTTESKKFKIECGVGKVNLDIN